MAGSIKAVFLAPESSSVPSFFKPGSAAPLRFVVSPLAMPSDAFAVPASSSLMPSNAGKLRAWVALATQQEQVLFRRAESLTNVLTQLRAECLEFWTQPKTLTRLGVLRAHLPFQSKLNLSDCSERTPVALILAPDELLERELLCQAHWSPEDIAAECWLEAAALLQIPVAQLLLDHEVHSTGPGIWVASYAACPQNLVQAYQTEMAALNFQLEVVTAPSQREALCQLWRLKPETMADAMRSPCPGELSSRYFNLFDGRDLC